MFIVVGDFHTIGLIGGILIKNIFLQFVMNYIYCFDQINESDVNLHFQVTLLKYCKILVM